MSLTKQLLLAADLDGIRHHVLQFNGLLTAQQYETVYEVTLRCLGKENEVLDWGCGNGHFSYFLTKHGYHAAGFSFEPSPACMKGNALFAHVEGSTTDPSTLPFANGRFGGVFSIGVLEHVYETGGSESSSLKEIHRVLRPGGKFLCFHFPNKQQWIEPAGKLVGRLEHFHHRKYSLDQIKAMVGDAGFTLSEWGRYNILPRNQLGKLPPQLKENSVAAGAYQAADRILGTLLPMLCTNFYFVTEKRT